MFWKIIETRWVILVGMFEAEVPLKITDFIVFIVKSKGSSVKASMIYSYQLEAEFPIIFA